MGELRTMASIDTLEMLSASESLETPSIVQSQRAELNQGRLTQLSWELAFCSSEGKIHSLYSIMNQLSKILCCVLFCQCLKIRLCHIFTLFVLKSSKQTFLKIIDCDEATIRKLN